MQLLYSRRRRSLQQSIVDCRCQIVRLVYVPQGETRILGEFKLCRLKKVLVTCILQSRYLLHVA